MIKSNRIEWFAGLLSRYKILILVLAVIVIAASIFMSRRIETKTDIQDLLPKDNPHAEAFNRTNEMFSTSNILITIEGGSKEELAQRAEELAASMRNDKNLMPRIRNITLAMDREFLIRRMLWLADDDSFDDLSFFLSDPNLLPLVTSFNDSLERAWFEEGTEEAVTPSDEQDLIDLYNSAGRFSVLMRKSIENPSVDMSREMPEALLLGDRYMYSPMGDMILFQVTPNFSVTEREVLTEVMDRVNLHINAAAKMYPHLSYGAAGDIPQEADEEAAIGFDMLYPALAALVLILLLFYVSLHSLRSVLFALIALAAGILFDIGIIGATIRELNMITSSFGALLVGLGIDFGIHIISYYGEQIEDGKSPEASMGETMKRTGKPVLIGGVTTALAFYALCFSKTKGFVQFGFVAGTGILTVLLAMFFILPALLLVFGRKPGGKKRWKINYGFLGRWGILLEKKYIPAVLVTALAITIFTAMQIPSLSFNYDMRQIGPQNTPAKQTEERILNTFGISPFPSYLTVSSIEEARSYTEQLKKEKLISRIDSISELVPEKETQELRQKRISTFKESRIEPYKYVFTSETKEDLAYEIQRLEWNLIEIADMTAATLGDDNRLLKLRDDMIREIRGSEKGAPGQEIFQKTITVVENANINNLTELNARFASNMNDLILNMTAADYLLTLDELPDSLKRGLVSDDGTQFLITIYPTDSMTDNQGIFDFAEVVEAISPHITGAVQLGLELSKEILSETKTAGLLVLAVVAVLLILTFRSFWATILTLGNLIIAIVWMMGTYALFEQMNIVNALALPLIVGIGVDYGIHIIHHIRTGHGLEETMQKSGKAIFLSACTTMIGFGSLALLGTFKGIATLGILLFIGSFLSLLSSLTLLPAVAVKLMPQAIKNKINKKQSPVSSGGKI